MHNNKLWHNIQTSWVDSGMSNVATMYIEYETKLGNSEMIKKEIIECFENVKEDNRYYEQFFYAISWADESIVKDIIAEIVSYGLNTDNILALDGAIGLVGEFLTPELYKLLEDRGEIKTPWLEEYRKQVLKDYEEEIK